MHIAEFEGVRPRASGCIFASLLGLPVVCGMVVPQATLTLP